MFLSLSHRFQAFVSELLAEWAPSSVFKKACADQFLAGWQTLCSAENAIIPTCISISSSEAFSTACLQIYFTNISASLWTSQAVVLGYVQFNDSAYLGSCCCFLCNLKSWKACIYFHIEAHTEENLTARLPVRIAWNIQVNIQIRELLNPWPP